MAISIASRWRELSGEKNWEGLMNPLDLDLRRYVIHYGERTVAVGDLFNNDEESSGFLHSLYPADEFFSGATLQNGNIFKYSVTNFFYVVSDDDESAWFGYVAVNTDKGMVGLGRRDILVAWRGTITDSEWANNLNYDLTSASELFGTGNNAQVHSGFLTLYTGTNSQYPYSARDQVLKAVQELVDKYQDEEISITVAGYSLGAALATLNAMDIVANGYNKPTGNSEKSCMVTAFAYASPRVGDSGLEEVFNTLGDHLHLLRITNAKDLIPQFPSASEGPYIHLGEELEIDSSKSGYLKSQVKEVSEISPTDRGSTFLSAHNLDVYLHGVAGVQESGFALEVDHDIALVNKHLDLLKDDYNIPAKWWENENRSNMVQMDNGHWKFVQND